MYLGRFGPHKALLLGTVLKNQTDLPLTSWVTLGRLFNPFTQLHHLGLLYVLNEITNVELKAQGLVDRYYFRCDKKKKKMGKF